MNGCKAGSIEIRNIAKPQSRWPRNQNGKFEGEDEDEPIRQPLHLPDKLQNDVVHP